MKHYYPGITKEQASKLVAVAIVRSEEPSLPLMKSSARLRAADANWCLYSGDFPGAACAALDSLTYSEGTLSQIYQSAIADLS